MVEVQQLLDVERCMVFLRDEPCETVSEYEADIISSWLFYIKVNLVSLTLPRYWGWKAPSQKINSQSGN